MQGLATASSTIPRCTGVTRVSGRVQGLCALYPRLHSADSLAQRHPLAHPAAHPETTAPRCCTPEKPRHPALTHLIPFCSAPARRPSAAPPCRSASWMQTFSGQALQSRPMPLWLLPPNAKAHLSCRAPTAKETTAAPKGGQPRNTLTSRTHTERFQPRNDRTFRPLTQEPRQGRCPHAGVGNVPGNTFWNLPDLSTTLGSRFTLYVFEHGFDASRIIRSPPPETRSTCCPFRTQSTRLTAL